MDSFVAGKVYADLCSQLRGAEIVLRAPADRDDQDGHTVEIRWDESKRLSELKQALQLISSVPDPSPPSRDALNLDGHLALRREEDDASIWIVLTGVNDLPE